MSAQHTSLGGVGPGLLLASSEAAEEEDPRGAGRHHMGTGAGKHTRLRYLSSACPSAATLVTPL
jgi:hypothetical protein